MAEFKLGPALEDSTGGFSLGPALEEEQEETTTPTTGGFSLGPALEEGEYEGVAQEFFEGVGSGLIGIPQGILELGASVVDLAADTDYASSVTDAANKLREAAGIDPVGLVGKGTEVITQFVIPGLGAASAVSKVSRFSKAGRLRKAVKDGQIVTKQTPTTLRPAAKSSPTRDLTQGEKLALGAQQVAAAGLADAVVATDGITTIGDFFEGGPTQTNQEIGLSGREEASLLRYFEYKEFKKTQTLLVDVGGGSTEYSIVRRGDDKKSKSFNIGTVRLINNLVDELVFDEVKEWIAEHKQK